GTEHDYTEGSLGKAITLLSIPMVLEMFMESLFGIVDVYFVSRLGPDAVASVGLTESMLTIIFAVAIGLSMATTAMVARRIGEHNPEAASIAGFQAVLIGVAVSLPVSVIGLTMTPWLLEQMGASAGIIENGTGYAVWMIGGNLTIVLLFLNNAIFRGAGDAVTAMHALWVANLLNMVLDPIFIFGFGPVPAMGVTGAAIATNIGRGVGVLFQLYILIYGKRRLVFSPAVMRLDPEVLWNLIKVSVGGIFQFFITTASWLGLVRIVAMSGSAALAGYTIAIRVIIFAIMPSWGMSNAAATLVGQNLGAQKPDRAERAVWFTARANMFFLGVVAILFISFAEMIIAWFTDDSQVVYYAVDCLRIISYGYVVYACGMVMVQAFNGAGDTRTPTWINLGCYWMFQIPLAYTLAVIYGFGAQGVFAAIPIAESVATVVSVIMFRKGHWKLQKI
ncbi:MAG TPA: MATE family efflux transporter, partial [bacterium]|nr:MATE family efflux transporter [bacterium]